jgi:O-antigen/teichoic acid export membrane protein
VLIPVLFGPGWSTAALVAPVLAIMGGVQATTFVLVAALEVLARFRWIWAGYLVGLAVNVIGGVAALAAKTFVPVLVSSVLALVCMHALHVALCHRVGLLDVRRLLRHYSSVVAFSCGLAAIAWILLQLPHLSHGRPWLPFAALLGFFVATATCWQSRARLAPLRLAKQYGIRLR